MRKRQWKWLVAIAVSTGLSGCDELNEAWEGLFADVRSQRPSQPTPPRKPLDCEVECKVGAETPNCLFLNATVSRPEYRARLTELSRLFDASLGQGKLPHSDVMALFDSPVDPCQRGDLEVTADGKFSNFSQNGRNCFLGYAGTPFGDLTLVIPQQFSGTFSDAGDDNEATFELKFDAPEKAVELVFSAGALNNAVGGFVEELDVTPSRALFRTSTICLASAI